jgi:predicted MFS family arabinose efflux permease
MTAFYSSIGANLISIIVILLVQESPVQQHHPNQQHTNAISLTSQQNFWLNYYALSRAFALAPFVGLLPFYYFTVVHVSLNFFGLVLSLFTISGFFASRYVIRLGHKFGFVQIALCTMVVSVISLILFGASYYFIISLIAISLLGFASGGIRPLTNTNLNTNDMSPAQRTSLFSSMERRYGFWNACILIAGGYFFHNMGFQWLMLSLAGAYVLLLVYFYSRYRVESTKNQPISEHLKTKAQR